MSAYPISMRDISFTLFEQLKVQDQVPLDRDDIEAILDAIYRYSADVLVPLNPVMDTKGVERHEDGSVTTSAELKAAYDQFCEDGWLTMSAPEDYDGQQLPEPVLAAIDELLIGACVAFHNYVGLTRACANMLFHSGSDEQKQRWAVPMTMGEWQGTMCLTEAGAGSDVGACRTTATPIDGGLYKIKGSKVFITSGEHDLTKNFVHIVLARIEGDPPGSKGLSIFIVPKYRFDDSGEATVFNDVHCTGIEEKMGIHGSVTTSLEFGSEDDCVGEIIGSPGEGMKIMFHIMNEERIAVGCQGQALGAVATGHALKYATERVQGSSIKAGKSMTTEKVAIIEHPDVRRMLLTCRAQSEGVRALLYWTAVELYRSKNAELDPEERKASGRLAALLTPICKAHGSEVGYQVCSLALQVYGGYGYCREYPIEQYLRDSRIACVYEGTNGIQALDFLYRKIMGDRGATLTALNEDMGRLSASLAEDEALSALQAPFDEARAAFMAAADHMGKSAAGGEMEHSAYGATPFMMAAGNLFVGYMLLQQAKLARAALAGMDAPTSEGALAEFVSGNDEAAFYAAKLETARFFVTQILPENRWRLAQVVHEDRSALSALAFPG